MFAGVNEPSAELLPSQTSSATSSLDKAGAGTCLIGKSGTQSLRAWIQNFQFGFAFQLHQFVPSLCVLQRPQTDLAVSWTHHRPVAADIPPRTQSQPQLCLLQLFCPRTGQKCTSIHVAVDHAQPPPCRTSTTFCTRSAPRRLLLHLLLPSIAADPG